MIRWSTHGEHRLSLDFVRRRRIVRVAEFLELARHKKQPWTTSGWEDPNVYLCSVAVQLHSLPSCMLSDRIGQSVSRKSLLAVRRVGPLWIGGEAIEFRPGASALQPRTSPERALDVSLQCTLVVSRHHQHRDSVQVQLEMMVWSRLDFMIFVICSINATPRAPSIVFEARNMQPMPTLAKTPPTCTYPIELFELAVGDGRYVVRPRTRVNEWFGPGLYIHRRPRSKRCP
jgi:hypothetical protein